MTTLTERKPLNRFDRWAIRVSHLMTRNPPSIRADATTREAISLLTTKGVAAAPVINEAGRPIGVLSLTDLLGGIRDQAVEDGPFMNRRVSDFMTPVVYFVDPDTPVRAVVGELLDRRIRQMYVADHDGVLVGVLGTAELLEGFRLRTEEQSCDESTTAA